jgi:hypothetical protein
MTAPFDRPAAGRDFLYISCKTLEGSTPDVNHEIQRDVPKKLPPDGKA